MSSGLGEFGWTRPQRRALIALLSIFCVVLTVRALLHRTYVSNPAPAHPARYTELADRVDPNAADWQTLATIPSRKTITRRA